MEYLSRGGGVHHLSGTFFHRGAYTTSVEYLSKWGGGTPPPWNIYSEGGGTPPKWNIYPEGGGYTTSVEYLCRRGVHSNSVECLSTWGGVHHLGGIFNQRGGYTTSVEYLSRGGGGTQPQWNTFPGLPFSPMLHFSTLFFSLGGGAVPLCCMVSHSSELSIFMMVFFPLGGCVGGGGSGRLFLVPF